MEAVGVDVKDPLVLAELFFLIMLLSHLQRTSYCYEESAAGLAHDVGRAGKGSCCCCWRVQQSELSGANPFRRRPLNQPHGFELAVLEKRGQSMTTKGEKGWRGNG